MDEGPRRHTSLTYVQPTMLKMVVGAAAVWGIGTPIVLAIKTGDLSLLLLAPLGLLLVPAAVVLAMFGRVLLWVQLVLFWYIRGVIAVLAMLGFGLFAVLVLFTPVPIVDQARPLLRLLPDNAAAVGAVAAFMITMPIVLVWFLRRRAPGHGESGAQGGSLKQSTTIPPANAPAVPPLNPPADSPRPLTYLEHRRSKTP